MLSKLIKWHKHRWCIVFVLGLTQSWTGSAFADILTWSDGTCWRRRFRWMDEWLSCFRDQRPMTWPSVTLFISLFGFVFVPSLPSCPDLICHSCSARWQDTCVCLQCVSQSEKVNMCPCELVFLCSFLYASVYIRHANPCARVCMVLCESVCACLCVVWLCVICHLCLGSAIDFLPL